MSDKYYRLVTFLVDIGTPVLRTLFVETTRTDTQTVTPFSTMHAYMQARKHKIDKLLKSKKISQDQYDLIYPKARTTDERQWDISLLCALLTGLFNVTLSGVRGEIDIMRTTRNNLQHVAGTAHISDREFTTMWTNLKEATKELALKAKGYVYEADVDKEIGEIMTGCLPNIGDTLRYWYMQKQNEMFEEIESMKRKLDDVAKSSKTSASILDKVVVASSGSSGKPLKKVKTVNQIIVSLRESFRKTLLRDLPEDFSPPKEVGDIRSKLRDKHIVVITGYTTSPYLETALYVIQTKKYDQEKCLMLNDGKKWAHIDPDEVDLVLFRNPFGDSEFDKPRAKTMFDIFENVLLTAKDDRNSTDVVIVSRTEIVKYVQDNTGFWPDGKVDIVSLYEPTTVDRPVDIGGEKNRSCSSVNRYNPLRNLQEISAMVLRRHHVQPNGGVVKQAKTLMRQHRVVLLTGQNKDTIESVVAELTKSYNIDVCLILTKPDDIMHVSLHNVCVVVAQYITGEFDFQPDLVRDWYTRLRQLEAAVHHEKLKVIITACPEEGLKEATARYGRHSMLSFRVDVPSMVTVKPDPESIEIDDDVKANKSDKGPSSVQHASITTPSFLAKSKDIFTKKKDPAPLSSSRTNATVSNNAWTHQCFMEMDINLPEAVYLVDLQVTTNNRYGFGQTYRDLYFFDLSTRKQTRIDNRGLYDGISSIICVNYISTFHKFELIARFNSALWFISIDTEGQVTDAHEIALPCRTIGTKWTYDKKRQILIAATPYREGVQIKTLDRNGHTMSEQKLNLTINCIFTAKLCVCQELDLLYVFGDGKVSVYELEQIHKQSQVSEIDARVIIQISSKGSQIKASVSSDGTIYYTRVDDGGFVYKLSRGDLTGSVLLKSSFFNKWEVLSMSIYNSTLFMTTVPTSRYNMDTDVMCKLTGLNV